MAELKTGMNVMGFILPDSFQIWCDGRCVKFTLLQTKSCSSHALHALKHPGIQTRVSQTVAPRFRSPKKGQGYERAQEGPRPNVIP